MKQSGVKYFSNEILCIVILVKIDRKHVEPHSRRVRQHFISSNSNLNKIALLIAGFSDLMCISGDRK